MFAKILIVLIKCISELYDWYLLTNLYEAQNWKKAVWSQGILTKRIYKCQVWITSVNSWLTGKEGIFYGKFDPILKIAKEIISTWNVDKSFNKLQYSWDVFRKYYGKKKERN